MTNESKQQLLASLQEFGVHGTRRPLRDFQCIASYLNWALNIYPLLCPGLCTLYSKTARKLHQRALLWITVAVMLNESSSVLLSILSNLMASISSGPSHGLITTSLLLLYMSTVTHLPSVLVFGIHYSILASKPRPGIFQSEWRFYLLSRSTVCLCCDS